MKLAFLVAILTVPAICFSNILHVPGDHATIQDAIDAAVNGDTVLVAPGTYTENISFSGKAVVVMSSSGAEATIINGNQAGSVITFNSSEGPSSVLEGFTITNGNGTYNLDWNYIGGGICCSGASPVIRKNIITMNSTDNGGGIFIYNDAAPLIVGNAIIDNTAHDTDFKVGGGGIGMASHAAPEIMGNTISGNTSDGEGGGIAFFQYSSPKISNNVIDGNFANTAGGGVSCFAQSDSVMANNIISGNEVGYMGGGMVCGTGCVLTLTNNLIYDNTAVYTAGGIGCFTCEMIMINNSVFGNETQLDGGGMATHSSTVEIVNTIFWNNISPEGPELALFYSSVVDIRYSTVMGGQTWIKIEPGSTLNWGTGMMDNDPTFQDPWAGDFHLAHYSPCIDFGDPASSGLPADDFEGDPRIAYGTVDMGADEFYTHLYVTGNKKPGGSIQGKFVGLPGTNPVGLFIGSAVLPSPVKTMWGDFHLQAPWILFTLYPIPGGGILVLPTTLPASIPPPYDVPMQALIGLNPDSLTNLCVLQVR